MDINYFDYSNFYEFYDSIESAKVKKLLQKHISQKCRVVGETVRNWISMKTIPFSQSNRVTEAVKQIAPLLEMDSHHITEKMLFPHYALEIEIYANH